MQCNIDQLTEPWKTILQQAGISHVWTWQKEAIKAWESNDSTVARFPQGGGRGLCALLMAQQTPNTLIVCSDSKRANHRQQQAQELGWSVRLWDGTEAFPDAPEQPVLTWSNALQAQNDFTPTWSEHRIVRVIFDGVEANESTPSYWEPMSTIATRWVFPTDALATRWWVEALANETWKELNASTETRDIQWLDTNAEVAESTAWFVGNQEDATSKAWMAQIDTNQSPAFRLDAPEAIILGDPPTSLKQLGVLGRRCNRIVAPSSLAEQESKASGATEFKSTLKDWIAEHSHPSQTTSHFINVGELLQELGHPVAPQPVFERGVQELDQLLHDLGKAEHIRNLQEVAFDIKIHSIGRFQAKSLQDSPELLAFFEAYDEMRQSLSPLDSLKLTFFDGKSYDLRLFAEKLPYDVATLNRLFRQLQDKHLVMVTLGGDSRKSYDKEYQFELPPHTQRSPAIPLWQQTNEQRTPLLWASLHTAPLHFDDSLRDLLSQSPTTPSFWKSAGELVQSAIKQELLLALAGRLLQQYEKQESPGVIACWELVSQELNLPGISTTQLLPLLPPITEVTEELQGTLKPLLDKHLSQESPLQELYGYALALPTSFGFDSLLEGYLTQEANQVLEWSVADSHARDLKRYISLAQRQLSSNITITKTEAPVVSEVSEKTEASEAPEETKTEAPEASENSTTSSNEKAPLYPSQPWSMAVAWAHQLFGQNKQAWQWACKANPKEATEVHRGIVIALAARQPQHALQWFDCADISEKATSALLSDLYRQLFAVCKSQARCKGCSLHTTSFCPAGIENLLGLAEQRPALSSENFQYSLAKRIRADLESNETSVLREVLTSPVGQQSDRVQRAILSQLSQRNEASLDELKKLATWAESHGDYRNAQKYRVTIKEQDNSDANNLQKLADLLIRQDHVMEAIQLALEATHNHPRRFPLEPWVQQHHQRLFGAPELLREALTELPAHPALSKLEEELTAHEDLLKQLQPKLEKAEEAMEKKAWGEAKAIAEEVLGQHPAHSPARLQQILHEVKQHERKFWQSLQRLPKNPKKRNQLLEKAANDAAEHGLFDVADAAYVKLLRMSPQYGLGYLKWARTTQDDAKRHEAYQKAINLSRSQQQMCNNLDEYVRYLEYANELPKVLPLLLKLAKDEERPLPKGMVERLLRRLSEKHGTQEEVSSQIEDFLNNHDQGKSFKRLKKVRVEQENMEPWKRALLSIKNKQ